ncbi:MAG TPA: alpha-amylase family glycosyl hydrolase [Chitinophagaceae bacterium]
MAANTPASLKNPTPCEVIYHVFLRSFYDSNGDQQGDLNGLRRKLDYLQELGVTSILLTPLYASAYYHNYFADDFSKIDPAYGTLQDWVRLVKALHRKGMKIYMDMEIQYVTGDHPWLKDSYHNPASPYSKYIIYNGPDNTKPEPIIYNISTLKGYNGATREVATVNLYDKDVQEYFYNLFKYWMDPNGDGKFDDGVDGFRIDHMMDDLDNKGILTDLFGKFWSPLLNRLREVNPRIKVVAEQANWGSYGTEYLERGGVDRVFAFHLQQAIASFNKAEIETAADTTLNMAPEDKQQVVFIENHDMQRFSSAVGGNPAKLRVGAALNLLIGGIPSIYYGQELGMTGAGGFGKFGNTDGNDIPQREAFEWYKADTGTGMALWYRNTGPWWDSTHDKPDDGISLEEEKNDPHSLWNFYRTLISIRKAHPVFCGGKYQAIDNNNGEVFSFLRTEAGKAAVVAINLSDAEQPAVMDFSKDNIPLNGKELLNLYGGISPEISGQTASVNLPPYGIQVWILK